MSKYFKKDDRTKKALARSLMRLASGNSIDGITVAEIVDPIGVTRQTFYNHFRDKYDLIDWIYENGAARSAALVGEKYSWLESITAECRIIKENREFYGSVYKNEYFLRSFTAIKTKLYAAALRKNLPNGLTKELKFSINFFATAQVKKISEWVQSGCREAPEHLAASFLDCLPESMKNSLITEAGPA